MWMLLDFEFFLCTKNMKKYWNTNKSTTRTLWAKQRHKRNTNSDSFRQICSKHNPISFGFWCVSNRWIEFDNYKRKNGIRAAMKSHSKIKFLFEWFWSLIEVHWGQALQRKIIIHISIWHRSTPTVNKWNIHALISKRVLISKRWKLSYFLISYW